MHLRNPALVNARLFENRTQRWPQSVLIVTGENTAELSFVWCPLKLVSLHVGSQETISASRDPPVEVDFDVPSTRQRNRRMDTSQHSGHPNYEQVSSPLSIGALCLCAGHLPRAVKVAESQRQQLSMFISRCSTIGTRNTHLQGLFKMKP